MTHVQSCLFSQVIPIEFMSLMLGLDLSRVGALDFDVILHGLVLIGYV